MKTETLLVLATVLCCFAGCSPSPTADAPAAAKKNVLVEIHQMYTLFIKKNQRPPQHPNDLIEPPDLVHLAGMNAIKKEEYIVRWGVDLKAAPSAVLAYPKEATDTGGSVLLADGSIKEMSSNEIKSTLPGGK